MSLRLAEVVALLDGWYDPAWAEDWDAVGLVCGDPEQPVERVLFAVDPAPAVVDEAVAWGADLLVCHHPLLLRPVHGVAATSPKGRAVHRLVKAGTALLTAHTNADVPPDGVNESLARAVGVLESRVIVETAADPLDKLVTFVPHEHADAVREAVTAAGAGAIGDYDSCTFTTTGEGRFRPLAGADPATGEVGRLAVVAESRVEAVLPRRLRRRVVEAMMAAHPYEEVAYDVVELAPAQDRSTGARGHGRIGALEQPTTLRGFADRVAESLPATAHGVRVAGDPDRPVEVVAVASGSGDFLLETVLGSGADVYLTSDLRHHPAAEFLEQAALVDPPAGSGRGGPALVDVAHWAAEWTWLPVAAERLRGGVTDLGDTVETRVSVAVTDPWTFRAEPARFPQAPPRQARSAP
jgi:dinuclear metal center YbgI/SA1388 family protein